jgi:YidC/Oxa1 family membrane protein insertase
MFLAFNLSDLIRVPFGYVLEFLYRFTTNYGLALILFAIIVRLVLIPVNAKSKKSMMKMSRLQPRIQAIQRKYENDKQKQQEEIQKLQQEEGATMGCGGCLWSLVPLFIMLPLYQVVRLPIQYMLHESVDAANAIVEIIKNAKPEYFTNNNFYDQMVAASHIGEFAEAIKAAGIQVADRTLESLNFSFLGIDLGQVPNWQIWTWKTFTWSAIGGVIIPLLSAGSQMLQMWLSQRSNNSVITNQDGVQDKEAAQNSQSAQQTKMMMWMMPLMSLWIGFTVPAALSLYWFVGGVVSMIENHIMTNHYRKVYDAEDALRLQAALEREREEAERERVRAEKRAANPDGITENTSKKKLQQKHRAEEEAARAAAAKEYAAKKGILEDVPAEEKQALSGIAERPYCKGRAYDPDRYNSSEE